MSNASELLNGIATGEVATYSADPSTEPHIVIGRDRRIVVPDELKRIAVQHDHNIETVTFDCPRYWDEHDLSAMRMYIGYICPGEKPESYLADDVTIGEDEDIIHFKWTISKNVTKAAGSVTIFAFATDTDDDGNEQARWNSELCKDPYVSPGGDCMPGIVEPQADIIEQLLRKVEKIEGVVFPTVVIDKTGTVTTLTITDKDGQKIVQINDGKDGTDGRTPVKGVDYFDGKDGTDGHTPVKGVDYFDGKDGRDGASVTPLFANSVSECTDTSKVYVLPDGYIYGYMKKTAVVVHNANDGTGLLNQRPNTNSPYTSVKVQTGVWASPPIAVDPSLMATTDERIGESNVTISGLSQLVPCFNGSSIWLFVYKKDGSYYYGWKGSQIRGIETDAAITLPLSFNLRNAAQFNDTNWANVGYFRIVLGIADGRDATLDDVANLSVNIPFFNRTETVTDWYSTGHMFNTDNYGQAIEANAATIEALTSDVEALKEAVKTTPSQSGAVWYAVGDSITKGYGVGADNCWVSHVMKYNGYDAEKSKNLGISGLGFAKTDPNYGKTARTVVNENSFAEVDLVTVAIGINDWKEPFSIDTVKSEMRYCFEKILTDNPYCKIIFIAPFNMKNKGSANTNWALGYSGSDVAGGTLQAFIDAQKSVCAEYGIQVIDMTNDSVINKTNIGTVLSDGIHPDAKCHLALGRELARRITFA